MTKFEWERELKKLLSPLSADEIKRVMEYYDELFMDGIDAGGNESAIIAGFGSPNEVARRILAENEETVEVVAEEVKPCEPVQEVDAEEEKNSNTDETVSFVFSCIGKTLGAILAVGGYALLTCLLFALSVGFIVGGIGVAVIAFFVDSGFSSIVATAGIGIVTLGIGIMLVPTFVNMAKTAVEVLIDKSKFLWAYFTQGGKNNEN